MKGLFFDPEKCTGCKLCSQVCALSMFGFSSVSRTSVRVVRDEFEGFEYPHFCIQCSERNCVKACAEDALVEKDGVVVHVPDACSLCGACAVRCGFSAISFFGTGMAKCDLCEGAPICAKFCATKALTFEEETPEKVAARRALVESFMPVTRRWFGITGADVRRARRGAAEKPGM